MMKIRIIFPALLVAAAFVSPVSANWFHNPYEGINRNIGSAPNPTPQDIRENRLPIAVQNEQTDPNATADAGKDTKTASTAAQTKPATPNDGVVASASPSR